MHVLAASLGYCAMALVGQLDSVISLVSFGGVIFLYSVSRFFT